MQRAEKELFYKAKNKKTQDNILLAKEYSLRRASEKGTFLRSALFASTQRAERMLEEEEEMRRTVKDKSRPLQDDSSTLVRTRHAYSLHYSAMQCNAQ